MDTLRLIKEKADYAAYKTRAGMDKITGSEPKKSDKEWHERHSRSSYSAPSKSAVRSSPPSPLFKHNNSSGANQWSPDKGPAIRCPDVSSETKAPPPPKRVGYALPGLGKQDSYAYCPSKTSPSHLTKVPPPKPLLPPRPRPVPGTSLSTGDLHDIKTKIQETDTEELKSGYRMLNPVAARTGNSTTKLDDKLSMNELENSLQLVNMCSGVDRNIPRLINGNNIPVSANEEKFHSSSQAAQDKQASQSSAPYNHGISTALSKSMKSNISLPTVNRILAPPVEKAIGPPPPYKSSSPSLQSTPPTQSLSKPTELHELNLPSPPFVLLIYSPWCRYCKDFFPAYNELAAITSHIHFYQIDGTKHEKIRTIYPTTNYPTIYWVGKDHFEKYLGIREVESLRSFIASQRDFHLMPSLSLKDPPPIPVYSKPRLPLHTKPSFTKPSIFSVSSLPCPDFDLHLHLPWFYRNEPCPSFSRAVEYASSSSARGMSGNMVWTSIHCLRNPNLSKTWVKITFNESDPLRTVTAEQKHIPAPQTPSVAELVASSSLYADQIVAYCVSKMGMQVGNGECWTLARDCLETLHPLAMSSKSLVHGALIFECIEQPAAIDEIRRGDILQMLNCQFEARDSTGRVISTCSAGSPDHTAIVERVVGDRIDVFQQNSGGVKRVTRGFFVLGDKVSGEIRVYRPMRKEWAGELKAEW